MAKIVDVKAHEILDSRGIPTICVNVYLEGGYKGSFSVPSGTSSGMREVIELRDNDYRYHGMGVRRAINNINTIIRDAIIGCEGFDQESVDNIMRKLDGTSDLSKIGGNAIIGVSIALLNACSNYSQVPLYKYIGDNTLLPIAMMNIINGGMHGDNNLSFQEFMIIPNCSTFSESVRMVSEIFHSLGSILKNKNLYCGVGLEGGYVPQLSSNSQALDLIMEAIIDSGYLPYSDVTIGIDVAGNSLYKDGNYIVDGKILTSLELCDYFEDLCNRYPIVSIEDPFYEKDIEGFKLITARLGEKIQIVGDDFFVSNKEYLLEGINNKCCNAIIIKPNQVGTITSILDTIDLANSYSYNTIMSHRSGDTCDTSICDIAVGLGIGQIKIGSLSRMERVSKYNRLMEIENEVLEDYKNS